MKWGKMFYYRKKTIKIDFYYKFWAVTIELYGANNPNEPPKLPKLRFAKLAILSLSLFLPPSLSLTQKSLMPRPAGINSYFNNYLCIAIKKATLKDEREIFKIWSAFDNSPSLLIKLNIYYQAVKRSQLRKLSLILKSLKKERKKKEKQNKSVKL